MSSPISRRSLLRAFGPSALLLSPILSSARPAAGAASKRRLVLFHVPNGVIPFKFWSVGPSGKGFDFKGLPTEALLPVAEHLTMIRGLNFPGLDHGGVPGVFTNSRQKGKGPPSGPSIDWFIAEKNQAGASKTPIHSLQVGVDCSDPKSLATMITYDNKGVGQAPENDPAKVFDTLFADLKAACARDGQTEKVDPAARRRRSILDALRKDVSRARTSLGLTASEANKLDEHESAIRTLELRIADLEDTAARICKDGGSAGFDEIQQAIRDAEMPGRGRIHADLIVLAFELDLTVAASIAHFYDGGNPGAQKDLSWFRYKDGRYDSSGARVTAFHHRLSHLDTREEVDVANKLLAVTRWTLENLTYLAQKMDAIKGPNGSMLEEGLILYLNNIGNGARHTRDDIPCLLLGSAGGRFPKGEYIYDERSKGQPHGRLLTSIVRAFGHDSVSSFGDYENSSPLF